MLGNPVADSATVDISDSDVHDLSGARDDVYTMEEAARRKGVSYHTVSRAVRSGKLKSKRLGRMVLIDAEDLHAWKPMRQRAPKRYRKPPDPEAVPGVVDLASGERVELARRLAVFSQTIHAAVSERDHQAFHQLLCDRFAQALGLRRVVLWSADLERNIATRLASYGPLLSDAPDQFSPIPSEIHGYMESSVVAHVEHNIEGALQPNGFQLQHVKSMLVAPLLVGDRLIGAFLGDWDGEDHQLSEDELSLTQIIANQAALAFDLARSRLAEETRMKQLSAILDNLTEAVSATNGEHQMLYMNKASRSITGYTQPESTLNRPVLEVAGLVRRFEMDGGELLPVDTPMAVALRGIRVRDRRYIIERPDGVRVAVSVNAEPIRDGDKITGAVAVTRDITASLEREVEEQAQLRGLERAVERARAVADISLAVNSGEDLRSVLQTAISKMTDLLGGSSGSIYFHRPDGNQPGGQMVGQIGYMLPGTPVQDSPATLMQLPATLVALAKRTTVFQSYARASTSERAVFDRYGFRSTLIVPLIVRSEAIGAAYVHYRQEDQEITDEDSTFAGALAAQCALAIEKARLHDELAAAHQRLVSVLDQLPYGIVLADLPDGHISFANSAACELIGCDTNQPFRTIGDLPFITDKPGLFGEIQHQIEDALHTGKPVSGQSVRVVKPEGDDTPAIIHVNPMLDGSDRQIGAICVIETGLSADRVGKLTTDIIQSISHELRNPLTSLVGNIQLLQRHLQGPDPVDITYVSTRVDRLDASAAQLNSLLKARK
jgi:excisionase family DNA binding protein/PAS domain S-box-containing protein